MQLFIRENKPITGFFKVEKEGHREKGELY